METFPTNAPLPQVICSMGYLLPAMRQLNDKSKTKNKPNAPSLMNKGRKVCEK
jgi:hypothetical protein